MLNLSSCRCSKPDGLQLEPEAYKKNLKKIQSIFKEYPQADILAAWGESITKRNYLKGALKKIIDYATSKRKWYYYDHMEHNLGLTKKGHPRHPCGRIGYSLVKDPHKAILQKFDINKYKSEKL